MYSLLTSVSINKGTISKTKHCLVKISKKVRLRVLFDRIITTVTKEEKTKYIFIKQQGGVNATQPNLKNIRTYFSDAFSMYLKVKSASDNLGKRVKCQLVNALNKLSSSRLK